MSRPYSSSAASRTISRWIKFCGSRQPFLFSKLWRDPPCASENLVAPAQDSITRYRSERAGPVRCRGCYAEQHIGSMDAAFLEGCRVVRLTRVRVNGRTLLSVFPEEM
jgi:hypothetical protein